MIYKKLILRKMASLKRKDRAFKQAKLAESLGIEPSYLSRFLSDGSVHFSDELLFALLVQVKFTSSEIEHLFLVKEYERTQLPERKRYLEERLKLVRAQTLRNELKQIREELESLIQRIEL